MCDQRECLTGELDDARRKLGEVERRERIYRLMFEHGADPTLIVDDDGHVLDENHAMRLYAEELGQLLPRRLGAWALHDVDVGQLKDELVQTGRASAETRIVDPRGRTRIFSIVAKTHAPSRHVVVLREITEQRELEERLEQIRRVDSLGYLAASVAHDLANLVTPILSASAVLAREVPERTDAAYLATEIHATAERAASLVRQVLAFVRKKPPEIRPVSLNATLRELGPILRRVVGPEIDVAIHLEEELPEIEVDSDRLEQAIVNLVANARDAMPKGGRLTLRTARAAIAVDGHDAAEAREGFVALHVSDTGTGMTPEVQAAALEDLFTTKRDGTGLGLASVRRFVARSGGLVSVRSRVGQGTTFVIYLPRTGELPGRDGAA